MSISVASLGKKISSDPNSYLWQNCPYDELRMTEEQCNAIKFIVNKLSEGICIATSNSKEIKKRGKIIYGMHPYKFLGFIISNVELKEKFKTIFNMYFWNPIRIQFFNNISNSLDILYNNSKIDYSDYLEGFAKEIKKDKNALKEIIESRNWEKLYNYFLKD